MACRSLPDPVAGGPASTRRPRATLALVGGIVLFGMLLASGYHFPLLGVRWTDPGPLPFRATDRLMVAAHGRILKDGAASLICLPDGPHLLVKARLALGPYRADAVRRSRQRGWTGYDARLSVAPVTALAVGPRAEMRANVAHGSTVDRVVSDALGPSDRAVLRDWFAAGSPGTLSAGLGDLGVHRMRATASRRAVDDFLTRCDRGARAAGPRRGG